MRVGNLALFRVLNMLLWLDIFEGCQHCHSLQRAIFDAGWPSSGARSSDRISSAMSGRVQRGVRRRASGGRGRHGNEQDQGKAGERRGDGQK